MGAAGGRFIWYELATTDIVSAKAFYARVLGWGTADTSASASTYTMFTARDVPVAGLMALPEEAKTDTAPQWIGYVGVDDVDAAVGRVAELGGTVHVPPMDVPNVSRFAVVADSQMATFALIKGREDAQAHRAKAGTPGHVGWHELMAIDLEAAFAFYGALLGWQKTEVFKDSIGTYQQFSDGGESIGGIFTGEDTSPWSLWLHYFNVDDIEAASKRVKQGGGQILYGPLVLSGGTRIVHCADPQGAIFALIDRHIRIAVGCYAPPR